MVGVVGKGRADPGAGGRTQFEPGDVGDQSVPGSIPRHCSSGQPAERETKRED